VTSCSSDRSVVRPAENFIQLICDLTMYVDR
jgi:hypothetical protein